MAPPKWKTEQVPSHKFEFIHIPDFHSNSIWAHLRYSWVWIMFFKAILVLCGDIWTCTILIISGSWTSEIKPTIDISIARWVFSACILLSLVLLAFDFRKANKVIKSQDISYAVSNQIVSGFYCLQKFDYFCFIEKIRNSSKLHDKLSFFVFFQLKGWKHLVVQAPRQVINIMTLIAFMKAMGFEFEHLDDIGRILPNVKNADKFTFCVMVFTSLMFIFSGLATLIAVMLWVPLVAKVQGNLKEYVCHKMDKRIDTIIKKTTRERANKTRMLEEMQERNSGTNRHGGNDGNGNSGGPGASGAFDSNGGTKGSGRLAHALLPKKSPHQAISPRRPKPTLPDIDVILANASEDIRLPTRAHHIGQSPSHQHRETQHLPPMPTHNPSYHVQHSQFQHQDQQQYPPRGASPYNNSNNNNDGRSTSRQTSQRSFHTNSVPTLAQHGSSHSLHYQSQYSDFPIPSPPQIARSLPRRQRSMASAASHHTDDSSPILYPRSIGNSMSHTGGVTTLPAMIGKGRNLSDQQQAARFYTQQQNFQQIYHQRLLQQQSLPHQSQEPQQQESASSLQLQPVQSQHYHDSNPRATSTAGSALESTFLHQTSEHPENWSSHYGFAADESPSETPMASEHFTMCRPDSGVLPDTMDPYYVRMTTGSGGVRAGVGRGGGLDHVNETEDNVMSMMNCRGSSSSSLLGKNSKIYQPDKTELEHYDSLYKETVTDTHRRVRASRSMPARSKCSRASFRSVSPELSYVMTTRKQQQHPLDPEGQTNRPSLDAPPQSNLQLLRSVQEQGMSLNSHPLPRSSRDNNSNSNRDDSTQSNHLPNLYNDPDRPLSVLDPPSALFMGHSRTLSNCSLASSTTSSSVQYLNTCYVASSGGSISSPTSSGGHPYNRPPAAADLVAAVEPQSGSSSTASSPRRAHHQPPPSSYHYRRNGSTTLSLAGSSANPSPRVSMDQLRPTVSPRVSMDQLRPTVSPRVSMDQFRTLSSTSLQYLRPYSPRQSSELARPYPTPPLSTITLQHQHEGKMELNEEECKRSAAIAVAVSAAETGNALRIEDVLLDLIIPEDEYGFSSTRAVVPSVTSYAQHQQYQQHHGHQHQQQQEEMFMVTPRVKTPPMVSTSGTPTMMMHEEQQGDYFFPSREESYVKVEVAASSTIKVEVDSYSHSVHEPSTPSLKSVLTNHMLPPPPPLPSLPMPAFHHSRISSQPLSPLPLDASSSSNTTTMDHNKNNDKGSNSSGMLQSFEEGEEFEDEDENEWEEEKLGTATRILSRRMTILSRQDGLNVPEQRKTTNPYAEFIRSNSLGLEEDQEMSSARRPETPTTVVVLSAPPSMADLASTLRASMEMDR